MKLRITGKGIHRREIAGIEKLKASLPSEWYGFTNLELIRPGATPREIDVVIVLDDRILLVDLKDWHGRITSDGSHWSQNDRLVGTSPVKKIWDNARVLAAELRQYVKRTRPPSLNPDAIPLVDSCVVLTGRCDARALPEQERQRVFDIDDFCRMLPDARDRNRRLAEVRWIDRSNPLVPHGNQWHSTLSGFFGTGGGYFRPLHRRFGDYVAISDITYEHPQKIYSEYEAQDSTENRSTGLLRVWDFAQVPRYASAEGREEIAGRERSVISYLIERQPDLGDVLLRPRDADVEKSVQYWEVFERRRQLQRLGTFSAEHAEQFPPSVRVDLARTLLSHVAMLHRLNAAHLDLGPHSVWLEAPSRVRLSHLFAASYPEMRSLGDRRYDFLSASSPLPEDVLGEPVDHFRKDTFRLACAVHSILFLKAPQSNSPHNPPDWDPLVDEELAFEPFHSWFECALEHAASDRFANAQEALDAFNDASRTKNKASAAIERLHQFQRWKNILAVSRAYPQDEVLTENDRVLVWKATTPSGVRLVKAWRHSCWGDERLEAPRLLRFCERAEDFVRATPPGVVPLLEVGYVGDHIVLVQEWLDAPSLGSVLAGGSRWAATQALHFLLTLGRTVTGLHERGWALGDLKPDNILVHRVSDDPIPALVDVLDLAPATEGEVRTPAYSPRYGASTQERDRFAVTRIVEDVLAVADTDPISAEAIAQSIAVCRDVEPKLATLHPLLTAIETALAPQAAGEPLIHVQAIGAASGEVVSDEGRYHLSVVSPSRVTITGAVEEVAVDLDRDHKVTRVRRRPQSQDRVAVAEKRAVTSVHGRLIIESQGVNEYSALEQMIRDAVLSAVPEKATGLADDVLAHLAAAQPSPPPSPELYEDGETEVEPIPPTAVPANVPELWRTLMDVEQEQFVQGTASADSTYSRERRRHFIPYQGRRGTLDASREDRIDVEVPKSSGGWFRLGTLDRDLSSAELIAVDTTGRRVGEDVLCSAGTEIRFHNKRESDSRSRRDAATSRILGGQAVVPDLIDYFDPLAEPTARQVNGAPSVEHVRQRYGLNESQADAFVHLWSHRPVGLLQGPPGTGKTKFIAALVHHALESGTVRNVLLASQAHEAVNNAAEGVLRLFREEGKEPSLVRLGQPGDVSDQLKPYHSEQVEARYREQFRAGLKQRFRIAGDHLRLPRGFVDEFFFLESTLWPVLSHFQVLGATEQGGKEEDRTERMTSLHQTLQQLGGQLNAGAGLSVEWSDTEAYSEVIDLLREAYGVQNREQVRRLREIATISRDWIGSVSSRSRSFEEFLANTRQIVCGTCVGLGRPSLRLASAQFDLVVIDEAARCTPSELAVPIQSARWVMLVGDHCQLEPYHVNEVVDDTARRLSIAKEEVRRSDFQRAFEAGYGRSVGRTLQTQYRMLPVIGRLVSDVFYHGVLNHGRTEARIPNNCLPELLRQHEVVWIKTDDIGEQAFQRKRGTSLENQIEADRVVDLLRDLDAHEPFGRWLDEQGDGIRPIGIICAYAAQCTLIRQRLNASGISGRLLAACKIDTVDSYQGKENGLVILSLVRNNASGTAEAGRPTIVQGFMAKGNRINVALSRAMDRLIIVGASDRWPSGGPMAEVSRRVASLAAEGAALFVESATLAEADAPVVSGREGAKAPRVHSRNVRTR
jgi:hypothetical protein